MKANYTYKNGTIVNAENLHEANEKHDKKCKYCNGKGLIQIAPNVRGLKKCPYCQNVTQ